MTQTYTEAPRPAEAATKITPAEMLAKITGQMDTFDALKAAELKSGLTAFIAKRDALLADYKKQYPALLKSWSDQHSQIQGLLDQIHESVPDKRAEAILACICTLRRTQYCNEQSLKRRQLCAGGMLEHARDLRKARFDADNARLDALSNLAARISAELKADAKLIGDIRAALDSPPPPGVALYSFWFKLLPSHRRLTPDGSDSTLGKTEEALCKDALGDDWQKCPADAAICAPPKEDPAADAPDRTAAPWLVDPNRYGDELDQAWSDCLDTKQKYADAESAFRAKPDDLAFLAKNVDDARKALDDQIVKQLQQDNP